MVAHREYASCRERRDHLGHHHGGIAGQVRGDLGRDARLALEVELLAQAVRELAEQRAGAAARAARRAERGQQPVRETQVGLERSGEPRVLHLHHHGLTAREARAVRLQGDRGCAERLAREFRERVLERIAQLGLDHGPDPLERKRRHAVAQRRERRARASGQHVDVDRGELAHPRGGSCR